MYKFEDLVNIIKEGMDADGIYDDVIYADIIGKIEDVTDEDIEWLKSQNDIPEYVDALDNRMNMRRFMEGYAKTKRFNIRAFHGTNTQFDRFFMGAVGKATDQGWYGQGFYFSSNYDTANNWGKYVLDCVLHIRNPITCNSRWDLVTQLELTEHPYFQSYDKLVELKLDRFEDIGRRINRYRTNNIAVNPYLDKLSHYLRRNRITLKELYERRKVEESE